MPPIVASCVYGAFIVYLFRRYAKKNGPQPWSLWVPLIWVTINSSRALAYWFSSGTAAAEANDISGGSFYDRNAYLLLMFLGFAILSRRRIDWQRVMYNCRWLAILYGYYLFSVTWSDDPFVSLKRWIKATGDIVMILVLFTEADPAAAVRAVFVRCAYIVVPVSVLFIKYYPDLGRYFHKWTWQTFYCGVTVNKNNLGQLAMLGGLFLIWHVVDMSPRSGDRYKLKRIWPDLLVFGMCMWLLHMARSSTSIGCFIIGTTIFFAARLACVKANLKNVGWCVAGMGILMLLFTVSPGFRGIIAGALGRDATLTDRTLIWDGVLKSGSDPFVGEGYQAYWLSGKGTKVTEEFHVEYAHNGYLDEYLDEGMIGVLLFVGMLIAAGKNATSYLKGDSTLGYLFLSLFWMAILFNYTEIAFGRSNVFGMLILLIVAYGPFLPSAHGFETACDRNRDDSEDAIDLAKGHGPA